MVLSEFRNPRCALLSGAILLLAPLAHAATLWQRATPEELSMTSQPQVPGAAAVILSREEIVDDSKGSWSYYARIKILTQAGRDRYSNVAIEYPTQSSILYFSVTSIAGRTIHPDGSIIPFTGKPFDRLLDRSSSQSIRETVFTLPEVEIGSIIEYRYSIQLDPGNQYFGMVTGQFTPIFYAQNNLFTRSEHFLWHTNQRPVALVSSLPGGDAAVKVKDLHDDQHYTDYTIDLANVSPIADEPFMPPPSTLEQKVVFYTQLSDSIRNAQDFWDRVGRTWSKDIDKFIGPPSQLSDAAAALTAGALTPEDKLRKLYATVQQMENTNFTRERSAREKKVVGISNPKSALDVLQQKRGDDVQLTVLFVGLARAAGVHAYVMAVTNRDLSRFNPQFVTFGQLNDDVAIVELNNQDLFLDPAEPLCPFGQLLWPHSLAGGLRQTATGTAFAMSSLPGYKDSETRRVANLTIDPTGHESGTVDMSFSGAPALRWRQNTLLGDETALHQNLEKYLSDHMPKDTDVTLLSVDNLHDAEKPLIVHFQVSGPLVNFTGKNGFVPAQLFHLNETSPFPNTTRTLPIEYDYPESVDDAIRLQFPASWQIDTAPSGQTEVIPRIMGCTYRAQLSPTAIILRRHFVLGALQVDPSHYTELRNFYDKVATSDHQMILFHTAPIPNSRPNHQPPTTDH